MKHKWLTVTTIIVFSLNYFAASGASGKKFIKSTIDSKHGSLTKLLKQEVKKAETAGLMPILFFYSSDCRPSLDLRDSLDHPLMKDAFQGTYLIIADSKKWKSQPRKAGFLITGTPILFRIDKQLKVLDTISGDAWGANIPKNMAPPLKKFITKK